MNYLIIPNEGKPDLLAYQLRASISGINAWSFRLFKNDIVLTESVVLADLEQADFFGYSRVILTRSDWSVPTIVDNRAVSTWGSSPLRFEGPTSPQVIYGCYFTDDDLNLIRGAYRFEEPFTVDNEHPLLIVPRFTYATEVLAP